jgi:hypothetical protein
MGPLLTGVNTTMMVQPIGTSCSLVAYLTAGVLGWNQFGYPKDFLLFFDALFDAHLNPDNSFAASIL